MNQNITELMKKIVTLDDLKQFSTVDKKLENIGEGYIFQDNKPTHVIMTFKAYQDLLKQINTNDNIMDETNNNVLYKGNMKAHEEINGDALDILLNKIGKQIFVDYYYVFKTDEKPEEVLERECHFTINSCRSRSSSARSIFGQNLQLKALERIISSSRLDVVIINKARDILGREMNNLPPVLNTTHDECVDDSCYEVKIGKMIKGVLSTLLRNEVISIDEINRMLAEDYSKSVFNLNFTVLREVLPGQNREEIKKDSKGYNRYYDSSFIAYGREFLICSQWVEVLHKTNIENWIISKMVSVIESLVKDMDVETEYCVRDVLAKYWPYIGYTLRQRIGKAYNLIVKNSSDIEVGTQKNNCQYYIKL